MCALYEFITARDILIKVNLKVRAELHEDYIRDIRDLLPGHKISLHLGKLLFTKTDLTILGFGVYLQ